jgi:hypothetical protein
MRTNRSWNWLAAGALLAIVAGCGVSLYPTPKPIVTGSNPAAADHSVQRPTFQTSLNSGEPSNLSRAAVPAATMHVMRPVAPEIRPFEQWTEQEAAADALGRIGAQAIPYLQQALRSPDAHVKKQAAEVLARMGSDAKPAVNDLIPLLDDPDLEVRKVAVRTLGRIGPDAAAAIPALMRSLVQEEPLPPGAGPVAPAAHQEPVHPVPAQHEPLPLPQALPHAPADPAASAPAPSAPVAPLIPYPTPEPRRLP